MRIAIASLLLLFLGSGARAETRTYVIAIGNNSAPPGDAALAPLQYADDDAAAFFAFMRPLAREAWLLTVLDGDSQRRFPTLAPASRSPTLTELDQVVSQLRARIEADLREGHTSSVVVSYSGHGTRGTNERPPGLILLDGALTQDVLYERVLQQLPARYIH